MEEPAQSKVPTEAHSGLRSSVDRRTHPVGTFHPQAEMYLPSEISTSQLGAVVGVQACYCFPPGSGNTVQEFPRVFLPKPSLN